MHSSPPTFIKSCHQLPIANYPPHQTTQTTLPSSQHKYLTTILQWSNYRNAPNVTTMVSQRIPPKYPPGHLAWRCFDATLVKSTGQYAPFAWPVGMDNGNKLQIPKLPSNMFATITTPPPHSRLPPTMQPCWPPYPSSTKSLTPIGFNH